MQEAIVTCLAQKCPHLHIHAGNAPQDYVCVSYTLFDADTQHDAEWNKGRADTIVRNLQDHAQVTHVYVYVETNNGCGKIRAFIRPVVV
jgi:hypothetical protein